MSEININTILREIDAHFADFLYSGDEIAYSEVVSNKNENYIVLIFKNGARFRVDVKYDMA